MRLEHELLCDTWTRFLSEKDKECSKKLLHIFKESLLTHMKLEEGNISPAFNKALKIDKNVGPVSALSNDHFQIIKLLGRVEMSLDTNNEEELLYNKNHFIRALTKHHKKEEEQLYNLFDIVITKKDWEEMLKGRL